MKELNKDILIFTLIYSSEGMINLVVLLFPYWASYYQLYDKSINMKFIYSAWCLNFFGRIIANYFLPKIIYKFGCKKTIQIGGLLYFINLYFFTVTNIFFLLGNMIFFGVILQFKMLSINFYMSKKYENGIEYLKHIYSGFSIGTLIWSLISIYIINPNNKENSVVVQYNGYSENYFDESVSGNFPNYLIFNGFVHFLVTYSLCFFVKDLDLKENLKDFNENINKSLNNSLSINKSIIGIDSKLKEKLIKSQNLSFESKTSKKFLNKEEDIPNSENNSKLYYQKEAKKIIKSKKFIILIIITILKLASSLYFMGYAKFISNSIIKNDKLVSIIFALVTIPDICGRYILSYFWKKYSFYKTTLLTFYFSIFLDILFIFIAYENYYTFLFLILGQTMNWSMLYLLVNMTLFSLYKSDIAIFLSKIYEMNSFLTRLYCTTMNYFFVFGNNFRGIFTIFLIGELFGLVLFSIYFKGVKVYS